MHKPVTTASKWSSSILWEFKWRSPQELFSFLVTLDEAALAGEYEGTKADLILRLKRAIMQVEQHGDFNKETREMCAPGAMFESMSSDQLQIRADYMERRKRLRKQLAFVRKLQTGSGA